MIKNFQLILALLLIILIIPQTPTENIVLRKFNETGFFTSYNETKKFLTFITWGLIFAFLISTFLLTIYI
jgi:protein translocase SecG subunit